MSTIRHSLLFALEWRVFGYLITILYLLGTGSPVLAAIAHGFGLQVSLFAGHVVWLRLRGIA